VNISEFLADLIGRGIELQADGNTLHYWAPEGSFTADLRQKVSQHKSEIVAFIGQKRRYLLPSFPQERLWFVEQIDGAPSFNIPVAMRLLGPVDIQALRQAFEKVIHRHSVLRTTFESLAGQPVQIINPEMPLSISLVDLRHLQDVGRVFEVESLIKQVGQQRFDLARGPLLRVTFLALRPDEHVLLVVMHHIVADGWSMTVLVREVSILYNAIIAGTLPALSPLSLQYADYTRWQRKVVKGDAFREQVAYWKQKLAGVPPLLKLQTDRPRPSVQTFQGAKHFFSISPQLMRSLEKICEHAGVSLFMLLLASLKALLYRYTAQEDIVLGTVIANRNRVELEGMIGCFINSLALRTDLSGNPSFEELLRRVRDVALEAYACQDVPFECLLQAIRPERDSSYTPIFQVAFVFQNIPQYSLDLAQVSADLISADSNGTFFDLALWMWEASSGLVGVFDYNADLFNDRTISCLADHFLNLLTGIVSDPEQPLVDLPLLTESERFRLLQEWSGAGNQLAREHLCIQHLFEARAGETPDAIAVVFGDEHLSYRELDKRAGQLARFLWQLGIGAEDLVGIYMDRSLDMIVGAWGVLKAGGAFVPMDSTYPVERLAFSLQDAHCALLLTRQPVAQSLSNCTTKIVCLDSEWERVLAAGDGARGENILPENSAYAIYTSGSTGKPKGVVITHRSLVSAYMAWQEAYGLSTDHIHLQMASFSFDVFVGDMVRALCSGGKLVLCPWEWLLDAENLYGLMRCAGVDFAEFVPAVVRNLVEYLERTGELLDFMRVLIVGSDSWYTREFNRLRRLCGTSTRLVNSYGLTEMTIDSLYFEGSEWMAADMVPVGRPFANTQVYLLDGALQPVPVGVSAELYLGGAGLARGYLDRPGLTAECFIPNPFAKPGTRLYRTGDLARFLPDGNIELLGRVDHQVKLRGFRVEPGEVEASLVQHPSVREAAVVIWGEAPDDEQLVAYIVQGENVGALGEGLEADRVLQWQTIYDNEVYPSFLDDDPTFNIAGWNSSYTNQPIPEEHMREWLDRTVERILSLQPDQVLEIGCGTGLLLFKIAPHCTRYWGVDFSRTALGYVQELLEKPGYELPQVRLFQRIADDLNGIEDKSFDTVILNSVTQHFPSIRYLQRVLEEAVRVTKPGGAVFVGDIRSFPLLELFHASVQLHRAPPSLSGGQLQTRIRDGMFRETELLVDPAFFPVFEQNSPKVSHVQVHLKRGRYHNEMTRFRYDAVLYTGGEAWQALEPMMLDWQEQELIPSTVRQILTREAPDALSITKVPNARLEKDIQRMKLLSSGSDFETVEKLQEALNPAMESGIDPEEFWDIGEQLNYAVDIGWSSGATDGSYDVVFRRPALERHTVAFPVCEPMNGRAWEDYANDPLQDASACQIERELRDYLKARLPNYMIPSAFVSLSRLPLTPNGKIDRGALPAPLNLRAGSADSLVRPRDAIELRLTSIWEDILNIKPVGVRDDFFELGGHSVLIVRLVSRVEQDFGVKIPLPSLVQGATIEQLAGVLRERADLSEVSSVVALQPNGSKRPFFCVHPSGGSVFCYMDLAHCLGDDRPFYGIQSIGLDGRQDALSDIKDMAACYIEQVRSYQPEGPYLLGGWSMGGIVAYEMAQQFCAQGQSVDFLAMLDTSPIDEVPEMNLESDVELLATFFGVSLEKEQLLEEKNKTLYVLEQAKKANLLPPDVSPDMACNLARVFRCNLKAYQAYTPEPYPGRVTLFRASERVVNSPALEWSGLAEGGVEVFTVPGDHTTMIADKDNVKILADQLRACLMSV
jgi:amino acid adenylation domain-containing protein